MDFKRVMSVKVLGSGCSRCKKTLEVVNKVVKENNVAADVEYVTDMMKVMEYNVMSMPAVVVDGKVKIKGTIPSETEVKAALGL
jgi:small redox-active disulfide protein 2